MSKPGSNNTLYVRGQDHVGPDSAAATGIRMKYSDVLEYFGEDIFQEIEDYGSAIIRQDIREPARTLIEARELLGLSQAELAKSIRTTLESIQRAEDHRCRSDIWELAKIAQHLGIANEIALGTGRANVDKSLSARLKSARNSIGGEKEYTPNVVAMLSEAGWVISTQLSLARELGKVRPLPAEFEHDSNYGSSSEPVYIHGYRLAHRAREILGISTLEPIQSIRELIEDKLSIPVVLNDLGGKIAGATVSSQGGRGVVLNSKFHDSDIMAFRFTMAHELGHLLWDGDSELEHLVVDGYASVRNPFDNGQPLKLEKDRRHYYIEARANAFAAEFLAPRDAVLDTHEQYKKPGEKILAVMNRFGIGYNCAKHQIKNSLKGKELFFPNVSLELIDPDRQWISAENNAHAEIFAGISPSRGSRFANIVAESLRMDLITEDMAACYLSCSVENARKSMRFLVQ